MHACGHDGHMAMVWGAGFVLRRLRRRWRGRVRLVFQPGEEIKAMARELVAAGVMGPAPAWTMALHGWPGLATGCVSARPGAMMAAAGFFDMVVRGRGGHGAMPEAAVNPIDVGADLTTELRRIPRAETFAEPTVVTVCRFEGGRNSNSIPDRATLSGTTRFLNDGDGRRLETALRAAAERIGRAAGADVTIDYRVPYIPTRCDGAFVDRLREVAEECLGPGRFAPAETSSMGAEDFAYFLERAPGVYARLGLGENHPPLHSPDFDFNDDALESGIAILVGMVAASAPS